MVRLVEFVLMLPKSLMFDKWMMMQSNIVDVQWLGPSVINSMEIQKTENRLESRLQNAALPLSFEQFQLPRHDATLYVVGFRIARSADSI